MVWTHLSLAVAAVAQQPHTNTPSMPCDRHRSSQRSETIACTYGAFACVVLLSLGGFGVPRRRKDVCHFARPLLIIP